MENALFFHSIYWYFTCSTNFFPFFLPLVSKKNPIHTLFFTHLDMYGSLTFCLIPMKSVGFRQSSRTSASFSPFFFRQYCGGNLWNVPQPAPHTTSSPSPKKPPLKGVTPHGVGRCPEETEGTANRRWWGFPSTF